MNPRIILLRLLIAPWAIPTAWLVFFPMIWLISGNVMARVEEMRSLSAHLWNGEP